MDEHQTSQSNSSDADIHADDDLSNSIIGKVRTHVSKILPNSLSKWLSPKTEANNSRRRRREELDTDDEDNNVANLQPSGTTSTHNRVNNTVDSVAVNSSPPNKRKKLLSPISNSFSSYAATHRNILSSTFIEEARLNHNQTPQSQSVIPHVNGLDSSLHGRPIDRLTPIQRPAPSSSGPIRAHSALTSSELKPNSTVPATLSDPTPLSTYRRQDRDDDNSSEMHDKISNPFAVNNDIPAINFNAHLQKSKSLFSNKSYLSSSRSLSNYRLRRQPSYSSSLYRSTSSLCDNNSSASTPSTFASPFYNGQTTFGGASSQTKRFKSAFHTDQLQQQHRSHVPSKLIPSSLSKSTSSLNSVDSGTSCLSTTAKRILDLMNQFNTPLAEVRQISNALPLPGNVRRQPSSLLDNEPIGNDAADRIRRKLLKPNTPYNRPTGRTAEYNFTNELKVPSMSQLLQLKKNTIQVREMANNSNSTLNRREEYKLPSTVGAAANLKKSSMSNNNNIEPQTMHVNKIRNNLTKKKVKTGKPIVDDAPLEPVNLPNIQLPFNKDVAVTFSTLPPMPAVPSSATLSKVTPAVNQSSASTFTSAPTKTSFTFGATAKEEKKSDNSREKSDIQPASTPTFSFNSSPSTSKPQYQNNNTLTNVPKIPFGNSVDTHKPVVTAPVAVNVEPKLSNISANYNFAQPIHIQTTYSVKPVAYEKNVYKFSEPIFLTEKPTTGSILNTSAEKKVSNIKGIGDFKFQPVAPSTSAANANSIANFSFGLSKNSTPMSIAAQPTLSSSGFEFGKSAFGTSSTMDSTVAQTKLDTFNKSAVNSSSNVDKKTTSEDTKTNSKSTAAVDDVFKSIAAKQKLGKWDCDTCMTRNDVSSKKCLACETPQPGASTAARVVVPTPAAASIPASKTDNVFKSIAAKQNSATWECTACMTKNDNSKTNCACCNQLRDKTTPVRSDVEPKPAVDDVFKAIAAKQKSTSWECSGCLTKNDTSKSKCVCCDQLKEGAPANIGPSTVKAPASQFQFGTLGSNAFSAKPATNQFSFDSGNTTFGSKPTTSNQTAFGSNAPIDSKAPASQFKFGSSTLNAKPTTGQCSFGSGDSTPEKASNSQLPYGSGSTTTPTAQLSFGSAQSVKASEPAATKPQIDDVFKKIVSDQTAKWECTCCMTKNESTQNKCVCCEQPKNGASTDTKSSDFGSQSKFPFGSPLTKFSFGAQPANKTVESISSTATVSASNAFSSPTSGSYTFGSVTPSTPAVTSTNTFKSTSTNLFSSPVTSATDAAKTTPSTGFQFSFGIPANSIPSTTGNHTSKDVTDTADPTKITASVEGVKVLENVLIKPAVNGPATDNKRGVFGFGGSNLSSVASEPKLSNVSSFSAAAAGPTTNSISVFGSSSASSSNMFKPASTPLFGVPASPPNSSAKSTVSSQFVFGQSNTSNSIGGLGTKRSAETTSSPVVVPKSTFAFGATTTSNNSTTSLAAVPPAFGSSASFSFSAASNTQIPQFGSASPASSAAVAPVFGASSFPTKGGALGESAFKPSFSFGGGGSANVPTFGNPVPTTNSNNSQGVFQFGTGAAIGATNSVPTPAEPFMFTAGAAPSFNFNVVPSQPTTIAAPFQFGSNVDPAGAAAMNIFAPTATSTNTNAIAQRRKLRPVRRNGRP